MAVVSEKPRTKSSGRKAAGAASKPARSTPSGKASKPGGAKGASSVRKAKAKAAKSTASRALTPGSRGGGLARKAALAMLARSGKRIATSAATAARTASERALDATSTATDPDAHRRPPVQVSLDVAVPASVAWKQWSALDWVPDTAGEITGLRRGRNGMLRGQLRGKRRWAAEISEQREPRSFAWRSTRGSDCAGLITFHPLSDALTRLELTLEARPLALREAAALTTRRADRRIAAELRRFKARLELISPDDYED